MGKKSAFNTHTRKRTVGGKSKRYITDEASLQLMRVLGQTNESKAEVIRFKQIFSASTKPAQKHLLRVLLGDVQVVKIQDILGTTGKWVKGSPEDDYRKQINEAHAKNPDK